MNIGLALQGGGSAGAFTAGALSSLLLASNLHPRLITGTSAGALNGAIITQTFNERGFTPNSRLISRQRLKNLWNDIAIPDYTAQAIMHADQFMQFSFPFHYSFFTAQNKNNFSHSMRSTLEHHIVNPDALQSQSYVKLIINAVDKNTHQETYFEGHTLNVKALMASAALPDYLAPVHHNDGLYIDGACLGGSNPPLSPHINNAEPLDAIICIMTNPPVHPIDLRHQKDLTSHDLSETNGLILHQAYNEIALLLSEQDIGAKTPPIHIIYPPISKPWTSKEKQYLGRTELQKRYKLGQKATVDFMRAHGHKIDAISSETVDGLRRKSKNSGLFKLEIA